MSLIPIQVTLYETFIGQINYLKNMKRIIKFNSLGIFFVVTLTLLGISLAYSIMTQKLGSYLTTFVFLFISISLFIRVVQEYNKENSKKEEK